MTNLYTILGLEVDCTETEVKAAFRKLSKIHHPDKGGNPDTFREISEAHEVLIDPVRRKRYNETGETEDKVETAAVKQLVQLFIQAASSVHNVEHTDLLNIVKEGVQGSMAKIRSQISQQEAMANRMKKVADRVTGEILKQAALASAATFTQQAEGLKENLMVGDEMLILLAEHQYRSDHQTPEAAFDNWLKQIKY